MTRTFSHSRVSLLLSAGSLLLGLVSITISQRVNYLDHLALFNTMAAGMLALGAAAFVAGARGAWKSRGRSAATWLASAIAVLILTRYLLDG